jgi:hypothetical protein
MQAEGGRSRFRSPGTAAVGALALVGVIAALAALLDLGPFGGGGGELSKADFIAKGDAICKDAHDQFAQLQKSPPTDAAEAVALTQRLIEISENELNAIRDLDAPAEVRPALDRYLRVREQGIDVLRQGLEAAQKKNAQAYAAAQAKITAGQVHRLKLAQAVGFSECSRPPQAGTAGQ